MEPKGILVDLLKEAQSTSVKIADAINPITPRGIEVKVLVMESYATELKKSKDFSPFVYGTLKSLLGCNCFTCNKNDADAAKRFDAIVRETGGK